MGIYEIVFVWKNTDAGEPRTGLCVLLIDGNHAVAP